MYYHLKNSTYGNSLRVAGQNRKEEAANQEVETNQEEATMHKEETMQGGDTN